MSPILDLQRRMREVGRIRMGTSTARGKGRTPKRLETWRLTSRDRDALEQVAELYGGKVKEWKDREGEFEVITETNSLDVLLIPGQALSQHYELWGQRKKGGPVECLRRCDGITEALSDKPCMCGEYDDRQEAAAKGNACKPTTRLSVLLPRIQGIGTWRFESHGYYAAVELAGVVDLLEMISRTGRTQQAKLKIDKRRSTGGGETKVFPVPVLDFNVAPITLVTGEIGAPDYTPIEAAPEEGVDVPAALEAANHPPKQAAKSRNAPADFAEDRVPLPEPNREGIPVEPSPDEPPTNGSTISEAQVGRLWTIARDKHGDNAEEIVRFVLTAHYSLESTKDIAKDQYDQVVTTIENTKAQPTG